VLSKIDLVDRTPSNLERLRAYRLRYDLSYPELARRMCERRAPVSTTTLYRILTAATGYPRVTERVDYKIGLFLDRVAPLDDEAQAC